MKPFAPEDILKLVGAFQSAWIELLQQERIDAGNIDRLPGLLMSAVLDAASQGLSDEDALASAALQRLDSYESELESAMNGQTLQ